MKNKTMIYEARDGRMMECARYKRQCEKDIHYCTIWRAQCPFCGETQEVPAPTREAAMTAHCVRCGVRLDPQGWAVRAHPHGWEPLE